MKRSGSELNQRRKRMTEPSQTIRSGMIAVVGAANVGKSTLVNAIVGEKVTIVSPVVQTTRNLIRAILTEPRGQLVFLDTPGVHKAKQDLGKLMNRMARGAAEGVDVILLMLDGSRPPREEDEGWMRRLLRPDSEGHVILAVNKCDKDHDYMADYEAAWKSLLEEKQRQRSVEWRRISAATGEGVEALTARLFEQVPLGPYLFPADVLTDYPRNLAISDMIREKYVVQLKDELPHAIAIAIDDIGEQTDGGWNVKGTVYVNRPSQKGIVLGAKGRLLKSVCQAAGKELSEIYERPVRISLWVKCEKDWARNFWMLKKLGYA